MDCRKRPVKLRTFCYKPILLALFAGLLALPCHACGLDWRYDPAHDSNMVRDTPPLTACIVSGDDINPVVLPQPEWPKEYLDDSDNGWQWADPQFGTGRSDAYQPDREATRIAEAQQYESTMAHTANPLSDLGDLPEALSGLDYRVEFGIRYRF